MRSDFDRLLGDLETLRRRDVDLRVFGANDHRYALNPPLTASQVSDFESRYGVQLPEDYRDFLLTIGNGGAGPGYGLERLGCAYGANWSENPGLVGDLSRPFPYNEAWNEESMPPSSPLEDHYWQQDEYWGPTHVNGAVPICHHGCNLRQCLIVTGPEKGHVWFDDRADWQGLYPDTAPGLARISFLDWYCRWLKASLEAVEPG